MPATALHQTPPERRRRNPLPFLVVAAIVIAVSAAGVGSRFRSPAERAASAAPPPSNLITEPISFDVLDTTITFRADLIDAKPVDVRTPSGLGDSLPVVTSLNVVPGVLIKPGDVLMTVAERPLTVLAGAIPVFRDMFLGTKGVDVRQLQAGLRGLGYRTYDAQGYYGPSTAAAVGRLYAKLGIEPRRHPADTPGSAPTPMVPRGEIVFAPVLPARVAALSVSLGGTAPATEVVCSIGSGTLVLHGKVVPSDVTEVHPGQTAVAKAEVSGASFGAVVTSVADSQTQDQGDEGLSGAPGFAVELAVTDPVAPESLGQNLSVTLQTATSGVKTWIVPSAAVTTTAEGRSFVTVKTSGGGLHDVPVEPGLAAGGRLAVRPLKGSFRAGQRVVVGVAK